MNQLPTNIDKQFIKKVQSHQREYDAITNDLEKLGLLEKSETLVLQWIKSFIQELDNIENFYVTTLNMKMAKFIKL